jgi:hypothetical protein
MARFWASFIDEKVSTVPHPPKPSSVCKFSYSWHRIDETTTRSMLIDVCVRACCSSWRRG